MKKKLSTWCYQSGHKAWRLAIAVSVVCGLLSGTGHASLAQGCGVLMLALVSYSAALGGVYFGVKGAPVVSLIARDLWSDLWRDEPIEED
jgi:hypothetical protein